MTDMKKEIIITDTKNTVYRYADAKAQINSSNLIKITFKDNSDVVFFPIINILNIRTKEY